jgi:hypothetical protein
MLTVKVQRIKKYQLNSLLSMVFADENKKSMIVELMNYQMDAFGKKIWIIAEGYIPSYGNGPEPQFTSHETACILNTSDEEAHISITVFYSDRDPVGPYKLTIPARRTKHQRFNDLNDPEPIPRDTDYATLIESDVPVVVQHTRLDSRQAENALFSTMAYSE